MIMPVRRITNIGERSYEFKTTNDVYAARELYDQCTGNQDQFEALLIEQGIAFYKVDLNHIN